MHIPVHIISNIHVLVLWQDPCQSDIETVYNATKNNYKNDGH